MTILSVGYPLFPVHPDAAGGAEQIVHLLDGEMTARGHRSLVVAPEGSLVQGQLLATQGATGEMTEAKRSAAQEFHAQVIRDALSRFNIDIIHFHGLDFHAYIPETRIPMLATMHLPLAWYPERVFQQKLVQLNCVSQSQAESTGLPIVLNGIDTSRYAPAFQRSKSFLWLGRICPEKGVHLALAAAKLADVPLLIAGPVHGFAAHKQYFREHVRPLLDDQRRYLGSVGGSDKLRLLSEARAVLVTSTAAETSSLVAMEAGSSGTPVIALHSGALPEVVEHGRTGFIANSPDELASYMSRAGEISPEQCRRTAVARFSATRMAQDYLALYNRILGTACAPQDSLYAS